MPDFDVMLVTETPYLYVNKTCSMDPQDISRAMGEAFAEVWGHMQRKQVAPAGGALSVYYSYDAQKMAFRAGFTIGRQDMDKTEGSVLSDVTPAGKVLHFTHKGPYDTLRDDYALMMAHAAERKLTFGVPTWEVYLNDPSTVPESELLTEVFSALT